METIERVEKKTLVTTTIEPNVTMLPFPSAEPGCGNNYGCANYFILTLEAIYSLRLIAIFVLLMVPS